MAGGSQYCEDCKSETLFEADCVTGDSVCMECGLVLDTNNIDDTHDVRIFEDNQDAQRIERPGPVDDGNLAATNIVGSGSTTLVRTARKSLKSNKDDTVREHREAMSEFASKLHVSRPVVERALYIFDGFCNSKESPFRGKDKKKMDAILVSCLYHAGKQLCQQKPMEEFAQASNLTLSDIFQAGNVIQPFIHTGVACYLPSLEPVQVEADVGSENDRSGVVQQSSLWDPESLRKSSQALKAHVSRLCRLLEFQFGERKIAEDMAQEVVKSLNVRRKPASTAGVLVWICSLLHEREADLELLSKNSASVKILRETYKELHPYLEALVATSTFGENKDWISKIRSP